MGVIAVTYDRPSHPSKASGNKDALMAAKLDLVRQLKLLADGDALRIPQAMRFPASPNDLGASIDRPLETCYAGEVPLITEVAQCDLGEAK